MKFSVLLITFFALFNFGKESKDVEIFTYWHVGNTQNLVIEEGFIEYENETIIKKEVTTSNVIITVLEETDSSYVVEWHYLSEEV